MDTGPADRSCGVSTGECMLSCDCPLEEAIDRLLTQGISILEVADTDGALLGVFDLPSFLQEARAGRSWKPMDSVGLHLQESAGTGTLPSGLPPGGLWAELMHLTLQAGVKPMFALTATNGQLLFANQQLWSAFPEAFGHHPVLVSDILPGSPATTSPGPSALSFWFVQNQKRSFIVLRASPKADPEEGVGALVVFELTGQLSQGHRLALEEVDLLKRVLDVSVDGLMLVDTRGIITLVNQSFLEIHGMTRDQAEGHPVTEVIENTRMHIVAQTGVAEVDEFQDISGHRFVVSRMPLYNHGQCLGAVGKIVFNDFSEIDRLASKVQELKAELETLRKTKAKAPMRSDARFTFDDIVAHSESSRITKDRAIMIAPTHSTVLLLGESGVGKEVYAQAIHNLSTRCNRPFIRVNCSAITETLFESELFGYADGAFTGAKKGGRAGKFELAHTGTIFLDEIGDMPLSTQAKLLRVLQEKEIDKVGGEGTLPVDVRVIAATNQDLWAQVGQGTFRKDLFYRINVIPILIPPLRERSEDVPDLVQLFWEELQRTQGIHHKTLSPQAKQLLREYSWPGNIRELRNVLERTLAIIRDNTISEDQVRMILVGVGSSAGRFCENEDCPLSLIVENAEKRAISFALARTNNNRLQAAKLLGISRPLLYRKMHQYTMI